MKANSAKMENKHGKTLSKMRKQAEYDGYNLDLLRNELKKVSFNIKLSPNSAIIERKHR